MEKIDLNAKWIDFLRHGGIPSEEILPQNQRREMKRAFMGGLSQMFILLLEVVEGDDQDAVFRSFDEIKAQLDAFWQTEIDAAKAKKI